MPSDFETGATQEGQPVSSGNTEKQITLGPYENEIVKRSRSLGALVSGMKYMPEFKNWTDKEIVDEVSGALNDNDKEALGSLFSSLAKHDPAYEGWTPQEVGAEVADILAPATRPQRASTAPAPTQPATPASAPGVSPTAITGAAPLADNSKSLATQYLGLLNEPSYFAKESKVLEGSPLGEMAYDTWRRQQPLSDQPIPHPPLGQMAADEKRQLVKMFSEGYFDKVPSAAENVADAFLTNARDLGFFVNPVVGMVMRMATSDAPPSWRENARKLIAYAADDPALQKILAGHAPPEPSLGESIASGVAEILPELGLFKGSAGLVSKLKPIAAIPKAMEVGVEEGAPTISAGRRILHNILTSIPREAAVFETAQLLKGEPPTLRTGITGGSFGLTGALAQSITETLPAGMRASKVAIGIARAALGGASFAGGAQVSADLQGLPSPDTVSEFMKGFTLSMFHQAMDNTIERLSKKSTLSPEETESLNAALRGRGVNQDEWEAARRRYANAAGVEPPPPEYEPATEYEREPLGVIARELPPPAEAAPPTRPEPKPPEVPPETPKATYPAAAPEPTPSQPAPREISPELRRAAPVIIATAKDNKTYPIIRAGLEAGKSDADIMREMASVLPGNLPPGSSDPIDAVRVEMENEAKAAKAQEPPPEATQPKPVVQAEPPKDTSESGLTIKGEHGVAQFNKESKMWETTFPNGTPGPTFNLRGHAEEWVATKKEQPAPVQPKNPYDKEKYPLLWFTGGKVKPSWKVNARGEVSPSYFFTRLPAEVIDESGKPTAASITVSSAVERNRELERFLSDAAKAFPQFTDLAHGHLTSRAKAFLERFNDEYQRYKAEQAKAPAPEGTATPEQKPTYVPTPHTNGEFLARVAEAMKPYIALRQSRTQERAAATKPTFQEPQEREPGVWEMSVSVPSSKDAIDLYNSLVSGGMEVDVAPPETKGAPLTMRVWASDSLPVKVAAGDVPVRRPRPDVPTGAKKPTPIGSNIKKFIDEAVLADVRTLFPQAKGDDDRVLRHAMIEVFTYAKVNSLRDAEELVADRPPEWDDEMIGVLKDAIALAYARPELIRDYVGIPAQKPILFPAEPAPPTPAAKPDVILPSDPSGKIAESVAKEPSHPETPDVAPPAPDVSASPGNPAELIAGLSGKEQEIIQKEMDDLGKLFGPDEQKVQQLRSSLLTDVTSREDSKDARAFYRNNRIRQNIIDDYDADGERKTINGVRFYALEVPEQWLTSPTHEIVGRVVKSIDELALVGRIFRDPKFETIRYIVVDAKGKVVHAVGVSSRMPGSSAAAPSGWTSTVAYVFKVAADSRELGGMKVYALHNHPSRYVKPSPADLNVTTSIYRGAKAAGLAFGGHVVIDDTKYSVISVTPGREDTPDVRTGELASLPPDPTRIPAIAHAGLGSDVGVNNVADFAAAIVHGHSHVALIGVENAGGGRGTARVKAIADMPSVFMREPGFARAKDYIKRFSLTAGVTEIVVANLDPQIILSPEIMNLAHTGFIMDAVSVEGPKLSDSPEWLQWYREERHQNPHWMGENLTFEGEAEEIAQRRIEQLPSIDEVIYQKAKPSFQSIHRAMQSANLTKEQFANAVVAKHGERVRGYVNRYLSEFESDESFRSGLATAGATGKLGALGRPSIVIVNAKNLPQPSNHVRVGQYKVDEQQRLGINLALDRIRTPGDAFLLADGAGVGKTRQELVIAQEHAQKSGKPSLIVTQNKQIAETVYQSDADELGIKIGDKVEITTYDGLKAKKGGQQEYGVAIFDEAHNLKNVDSDRSFVASQVKAANRIFATATPMDNAHNAAYFMSLITGLTEEEVQNQLGYTVQYFPDKIDPTILRPVARTLGGITWAQVFQNIRDMRDEAIARGAMIRREYPFYGRITSQVVPMSEDDQTEQEYINSYWQTKIDSVSNPATRRNFAGQRTGELSRWVESKKIASVYAMMKEDLAEGKSVIIVAEGVAESVNKALSARFGEEIKTPGFLTGFEKMLDKEGIGYAKIFGGGVKSSEVKRFQSGAVKVAIMTPKSGGAGISLDDVIGNSPRTMYIATVNFGGDVFDQIVYRASRRNTASPVDLKFIHANGSISDARRATILSRKFGILRNIQAGEDPDIAALMNSADVQSQRKADQIEQTRSRWGVPQPPPTVGPAIANQQPNFGSLGKAIVNAWRGQKYILVDGVSGFVAKPAYDIVLAGKKTINYLGLPQFVGYHVPALRGAFVALKDAFHVGNERFSDVKDVLNYVRDVIRLNPAEKGHVAEWLWRGNDEDVRRYFARYELLQGMPGLGLAPLTAKEADAYERLVRAQGLGSKITMDAMKYFLMNYPLEDEEIVTRDWGTYDAGTGVFIVPPAQGSLEEQLLSTLSPTELRDFFGALAEIKNQGAISTPSLMASWDTTKEAFKEPIIDAVVEREVNKLGGYLSQQRHGDYYVGWNDAQSGKFQWQQHELESEAVTDAKRRAASGQATNVTTGLMTEPGFLSKFAARDMSLGELLAVVDKLGLMNNPGVVKLVSEWKRRGFAAHTIKRRNVLGYERTYDNAVRSIYDYGQGASRHYMRTKGRLDANAVLARVDAKQYPYHYQLVTDYIDGYFSSSERDGQALRKVIYVSNLMWSVSFLIQQMFQPVTMHAHAVVREMGSVKAAKIMGEAAGIAAAYVGVRAANRIPGVGIGQVIPQELLQFLDRAMRRESIAGSMIEELAANASRHGGHLYAPRLTGLLVKAGAEKETVQSAIRTIEALTEFVGSVTEKNNRVLGFVEGYLMGKEKGLSGERLFRYAEIWTGEVNIEYGKHNLPVIINQTGRAKPIARMFYTFMSYQFAAMHLAARDFRADRPFANRVGAVLTSVLGYTVAAGLLGNIFGGLFGMLWDKFFHTDTPEKLITQNEAVPEWLRKIVDAGVLSLLGVDMRRSLGVGDINPLDVSKTVPVQLYTRAQQAWEEVKRGNYTRAITRSPVGAIPPLRGLARAQESERYGYQYGRKAIVAPQDLTARDILTLSLNLTPYKLGKEGDVRRTQYDELQARREKYDTAVEKVTRGSMVNDQSMVDEGIRLWQDYNQDLIDRGQGYLLITPEDFMGSVQRRLIETNAPDLSGTFKQRVERQDIREKQGTQPRSK